MKPCRNECPLLSIVRHSLPHDLGRLQQGGGQEGPGPKSRIHVVAPPKAQNGGGGVVAAQDQ